MSKRQERLEQAAIYRDLTPEQQRALEQEPEAAARLALYRRMDEDLARLADPKPDPEWRRATREALEREAEPGGRAPWLRQAPSVAFGAATTVAAVLFLVALAYFFRAQLRSAAGPAVTATETQPALLSVEGTMELNEHPTSGSPATLVPGDGTPTPWDGEDAVFNNPTPTYPVEINLDAPFAEFARVMAAWDDPTSPSQALLVMRTAIKTYLTDVGSIQALQTPEALAQLEAQLRPHVPAWHEGALQLADVDGDGRPELVAAILPFVDVYFEDDAGVFHARGLPAPAYGPLEGAWPVELRARDLTGDGRSDLLVTYRHSGEPEALYEVLLASWFTTWIEQLRVPATATLASGEVLRVDEAGDGIALETYCSAPGSFERSWATPLRQAYIFIWDGTEFVLGAVRREEPATAGQYASIAEAYLRQGQYGEALARYEQLAGGTLALADDPTGAGEPITWEWLAALRAGQLHALLGNREQAAEALQPAMLSSSMLGLVAGHFGAGVQDGDPLAEVWMRALGDEAFTAYETAHPLLPAGVAFALWLNEMGPAVGEARDVDQLNAVAAALAEAYGVSFRAYAVDDVDGDASVEIVLGHAFPGRPATVWLLDDRGEEWYAVRLGEMAHLDQMVSPIVGGSAVELFLGEKAVTWYGPSFAPLARRAGRGAHYALDAFCPLQAEAFVLLPPARETTIEGAEQSQPPAAGEVTPTPIPPPAPAPTPSLVVETAPEPLAEGLVEFAGWSSSGRWLAYWERSAADVEANPHDPPGALTLVDVESGERCQYPRDRYDGTGPGVRHVWLADDTLLVFSGQIWSLGSSCRANFVHTEGDAPAEILEVAAVDDGHRRLLLRSPGQYFIVDGDPPAGLLRFGRTRGVAPHEAAAFSFGPAGELLAISMPVGGTTIVDVAWGEIVEVTEWMPSSASAGVLPPVWLDGEHYLVPKTLEGPLLATVGGEAEPVAPLMRMQPAPAQVAMGSPAPGGYAIALFSPGGPVGIWLYHSERGLLLDGAAFDAVWFAPAGREVALERKEGDEAGARSELWRLSLAGGGRWSTPELVATGLDLAKGVSFAPDGPALAFTGDNRVLVNAPDQPDRSWELNGYHDGGLPHWSPNGRRLAVEAGLAGTPQRALFLIAP